jgi:hypothetical protein
MDQRRIPPYSGYERPNFTTPPPGAAPSSGNIQARPNFTFPGADPTRPVGDAEFNRARPVGGDVSRPPSAATPKNTISNAGPDPRLRGAAILAGGVEALDRGTQAVTDFQQGNNMMGGYNSLRAAAGIGAARMNPVAAAFMGGSMVGDQISNNLSDTTKDAIGYTINKGVRATGNMFGQDWGVDDSALLRSQGMSGLATPPAAARTNDPAFTLGQETLARTGVTQDPSIGGGRSRVLNTTNYKDPSSPGVSAYDRTADVRSAIETGNIPKSLQDGNIWRSGNAYTGRNVKEGAQILDARTGMPMKNQGTLSIINNNTEADRADRAKLMSAAQTGDMTGLSDLQQRQAALLRDGGRFDAAGNIMTRQTQETLARAEQRQAAQQAGGGQGPSLRQPMSIQDGVKAQVAALKQMGAKISMPTLRQILQNETQRFNAESGNLTTLRTNAENNATTRENNAAARRNSEASAQAAEAKARQEQDNKDREFGLNFSKAQIENRRAGEKNVIDRMTSLVPTTGDAAKDGAARTQMLTDLNQFYGQEMSRLQEQVKANPKDEQSAVQLRVLREQGLAALEGREQEIWQFSAGRQARAIGNANSGFWMGSGQPGTSNKPIAPGEMQYQKSAIPFHQGYAVNQQGLEIPWADLSPDIREALQIRKP